LFTICCILTSIRENIFCLMSYYRKAYNQTGTGHFGLSSLYNSVSRKILIRDVARFKYNSIWSSLEKAYSTLTPIDNQTNKPRGFLLCGKYF
jgi:glutathione gamma-glutamylcysteinyltransferase